MLGPGHSLQPLGVPGEIYIGGEGLSDGYLHEEALTRGKFISDPFKVGEYLYKTGDLGRWTKEGEMEYLGRLDDQVKIRGYRIELGEVESQLASHEEVAGAIVLAKGEGVNRYLVGYYVSAGNLNRRNYVPICKNDYRNT